jgi:thiamine-phosphate pyrophosphorylase
MKRKIESGVYLVVDSGYGQDKVMKSVTDSMKAGLDALQLWASWKEDSVAIDLGRKLAKVARDYSVPFVVNNDLEVALKIGADGVHTDGKIPSPKTVKEKMGPSGIAGVTCSTDIEKVLWASSQQADYVSFCSMFPSSSVADCDIVPLEMLGQARKLITIPIFASGGINLENAHTVVTAGADGVAVISAIMAASDAAKATAELKEVVKRYSRENPFALASN